LFLSQPSHACMSEEGLKTKTQCARRIGTDTWLQEPLQGSRFFAEQKNVIPTREGLRHDPPLQGSRFFAEQKNVIPPEGEKE